MKEDEKTRDASSKEEADTSKQKPIAAPHDEHHVPTWLLVIIGFLIGGIIAGGTIYTWQRSVLQVQLSTARAQANASVSKLQSELQSTQRRLTKRIESLQQQEEEARQERFAVSDAPQGERVKLDDTWDLYINDERGFSLEIPRMVSDGGSCISQDDPFEGATQPGDEDDVSQKLIATTVVDTQTGLYIAPELRYVLSEEEDETCAAVETTKDNAASAAPSLAVYTENLPDDVDQHGEALDAFAAEVYGENCEVGSVTMTGDAMLTTVEDAESNCVAEEYVFVYDEELGRAATFEYAEDIEWRDLDDNIRLPRNLTLR
jgi:hypothetical protein